MHKALWPESHSYFSLYICSPAKCVDNTRTDLAWGRNPRLCPTLGGLRCFVWREHWFWGSPKSCQWGWPHIIAIIQIIIYQDSELLLLWNIGISGKEKNRKQSNFDLVTKFLPLNSKPIKTLSHRWWTDGNKFLRRQSARSPEVTIWLLSAYQPISYQPEYLSLALDSQSLWQWTLDSNHQQIQ